MKIKKYSCEQFAGIEADIQFEDGINIILGNNESGKSTIVSGLYHTIATPYKVGERATKDKDFRKLFMPSNQLSDSIDSRVTLENDGIVANIEKEWGDGARVKVAHDGSIYRENKAEQKIEEFIKFGEAFYNYIVFGRQANSAQVLAWILGIADDERDQMKKYIADSATLSAISGISIDKLEALITDKIRCLENFWDKSRGRVEPGRRRQNGIRGSLYEAYYQLDDAKKAKKEVDNLIDELKVKIKERSEITVKQQALESNKDKFEIKERLVEIEARLKKCQDAKLDWPISKSLLDRANQLKSYHDEQERRNEHRLLCTKIEELKALKIEIESLEKGLGDKSDIEADNKKAGKAEKVSTQLRAKIEAIDLTAKIDIFDPHQAIIEDIAEGKREIKGSHSLDLTGFLNFEIPGIAKLAISSKGIDPEQIKGELNNAENVISEILNKYQVTSLAELQDLTDNFLVERSNYQSKKDVYTKQISSQSPEQLIESRDAIKLSDADIPENLDTRINDFLSTSGERSLDMIIGAMGSKIGRYEQEYCSVENLDVKIIDYTNSLEHLKSCLVGFADIKMPTESVETALKKLQDNRDLLSAKIGELENKLDNEENSPTAVEQAVEAAQAEYDLRMTNLNTYKVLLSKLTEQKEKNNENPLADFREKLAANLALLSDGSIVLNDLNNKLDIDMQSGKNLLRHDILSEGTKETILLAYRLAVLEAYFPEGDACLVLDDILLDMDPNRRKQAVKLLTAFSAKGNQVIMTTCDPAMADLLPGNLIEI